MQWREQKNKEMIAIGDWLVDLNIDYDGHLTLGINHLDNTKVFPIEEDLSTNENEWVERFTTKGTEENPELY